MSNWIVRGLAFAAGMVVLRLFQGALINAFQSQAGLISIGLVFLYLIVVVVWGLIDGRADAREQPDPDRRKDLAMTWLLAGLLAGVLGGAVVWLISMFYTGLYTGGLINEVSTFAAFTALLVFLPGMGAVTLGRWLIDRKGAYASKSSGDDDDRADTDVFDAVHEDETPTGEVDVGGRDQEHTQAAGGEQSEERRGAVATAEAERRTEAAPTARREEKNEPVRTDDRTDTIRTDDHTETSPTEDRTEEVRTNDRTQAEPAATDAEQTLPTRRWGEDQR